MEVIGLMKNHTVLKKKSFHKFMKRFDDIEYMLFIADDTFHTFIMHKPKDYMKKFAKAITYKSRTTVTKKVFLYYRLNFASLTLSYVTSSFFISPSLFFVLKILLKR